MTAALFIEKLKSAFWVLPAVVAISIVALLVPLQLIEIPPGDSSWYAWFLYDASPQGARLILNSIATATMTVVGVLFSVTIIVLQQVSSQYAPRIIQNFVRSTPNQVVLGFYLGTFSYSLLLLRNISDGPPRTVTKLPEAAMSFSIVLAVACLCLLIYYVHHTSSSIQSTRIISGITDGSLSSMENIVRDRREYLPNEMPRKLKGVSQDVLIPSKTRGYLQYIDWKGLKRFPRNRSCHIVALRQPGEYLQEGTPLFQVSAATEWSEKDLNRILRAAHLGPNRSHAEDPEFGVRQLADIALRSLSPAMNDPSTAREAIQGIGTLFLAFVRHHPIQNIMQLGRDRFIELPRMEADPILGICFDEVIQFAGDHLQVLNLISDTLKLAEARATDSSLRSAIARRRNAVDERISELTRSFSWMRRQTA